ncbi:MAG: Bro-N domain-containing protein [Candidatus Thermoplasmatota archaeon]|nr:Bro-N domain-containing protein [Euryarchaeota archaeon]MBU4032032.1 Bro-N domain-containing protein [Candidatus Thermoplasmatota archaeon]MBU4070975.1 Bro-N domain-containing protein [Candidatus Thermoplasmatota archaeon]MBU4143879.1 Bro-N domain-containing protein [Candidatus Thermoplasmatota archaeon]MBU4592512.1 Bro-N domain-containing protein [Candidatus Thermoplasmatota archaeon]
MAGEDALVVFRDIKIRRIWFNEEWHYSVTDIVAILTDSKDEMAYWRKLKQREPQLVTICHGLKMPARDGKMRYTDCVNTKDAFRLIQSIPSRKAEPFKQWLAQMGKERIDEIENPEIAQDRVRGYYELKGYPKEWIEKRLRGIAIRQDLTDEWTGRGVEEEKEFAILTNEITKATFGKAVKEYKEFKGLEKPGQNLRDHMTDWELILTMIGEKATTDITISKDAEGFEDCKESAVEGGMIARNTRREIEKKTGKSLVSNENYLQLMQKKQKRIQQNTEKDDDK